jgi:uncharacterized protein (UPF0128 family)
MKNRRIILKKNQNFKIISNNNQKNMDQIWKKNKLNGCFENVKG